MLILRFTLVFCSFVDGIQEFPDEGTMHGLDISFAARNMQPAYENPSLLKFARLLLALRPHLQSHIDTSSPTVTNNANLLAPLKLNRRFALWSAFSTLGSIGTPIPALATKYHKSKPQLGVVLPDEVRVSGNQVSADVVLDQGVLASVAFESNWPCAKSVSYDVEAGTKTGESAFLQIKELKDTETLATVSESWFTSALGAVRGRFGAYGEPTGMRLKEFETDAPGRSFQISFDVLTPAGTEIPRKGFMRALQASGSPDVLMFTCSAPSARWQEVKAEAKATALSFQIVTTRPTALKRDESADYRPNL